MSRNEVAAIIVASGRGVRAGDHPLGPKQFRTVGGQTVLARTVELFAHHASVSRVVLVTNPDDRGRLAESLPTMADFPTLTLVDGGATRQASVRNGLLALKQNGPQTVLIHDAVRPFATPSLIDRVAQAVTPDAGALPVIAVSDTLKRGDGGFVAATIDRSGLYAAQTPQGFPYLPILAAHERARRDTQTAFTDDASIAEWAGLAVRLVDGEPDNIKLTSARDIELADARLRERSAMTHKIDVRTGNGYDVHQLVAGEQVTLCGVEIPHDQTLSGHSDADVGLHALTDALLATCGAGDIGDHFPPSDPQWRGAPSRIFLERARDIVTKAGGRIMNADISLICEAPKIAPYRDAMRQAIADCLRLSMERVSVKATTNETIGFVGRREGIAAIATASVAYGETD
ncbi:bifunctional 2-C-methyl-D-erythritol 4-phosphate cytidylyltransferase/2-C-methyl-D-erythritol 2,4-cyclodiphosphate synthase [Fulvimarina sp. 2208YS6-2-32]|uniref:Bifunctional enzyme IspD/IspF n=1 Tax=Fulvimarina uroteuthidis TaxID=3098149 RepID=A0ABU5I4N6_9HYPH|nr:bifunctional 2-C-methyl-D-erythritol 4-phosphate cytidylyltransferase/2-C-methyl-D-erythritol 2,4-cyclodiphosphate synthase [Fulvimarina sp. 2208YS6-2-32]MDY8110357.1 bifunctional 2-C-methyl-D-erythritol 4-phosphate cytidylyltransferase/2-C-methyl-D-erythritol 2,4-cyclodiphosphate synthase [Fulvimarina sp. 2208YS6-2-32]